MKKLLQSQRRTLGLLAVLLPMVALLAYVALRAGPLAPVPVSLVTVERQAITPALFGIGTVAARYTHKIGPTFAGRVQRVEVQPGDRVKAGQLLGEMDPVDLDDRIKAQDAALQRAQVGIQVVEAQMAELGVRNEFADKQSRRYQDLLGARSVSAEAAEVKRNDWLVAQASLGTARANLAAATQDVLRVRADRAALVRQRANLRLLSPTDGIVTRRDADPGTTVVAGQAVVEVIEPGSLWISARFDQQRAIGLQPGLPVQIVLRSRADAPLAGTVARIEPHADAVTEEALIMISFAQVPQSLPAIGELAEVTVTLAPRAALPVVPNASIQRIDGRLGVWVVADGELRFAPIATGASDLDGRVQVVEGLKGGERVVVHSQKALTANSRIKIVDRVVEAAK